MFGKSLIRRQDRDDARELSRPFAALHREMNRLFESFFSEGFGADWGFQGEFSPSVNISESDQEVHVTAELPGVSEKDIEVSLTRNALTIRGEKRDEREEKEESYHRVESAYGSFERTIPLPADIETDKVEAKFSKGVLTITLPKTKEAQTRVRQVKVKAE